MAERLEVSVDIDMGKVQAQLNKLKGMFKASGQELEKTASISATKAANASITADKKKLASTQTTTKKQAQAIIGLANLSTLQIEKMKSAIIADMKQIDASFKLDPTKNAAAMKKWESDIRKVGVTATDTGKKLDKIALPRYIEIGIQKNKLTLELNAIKNQIAQTTAGVFLEIDIEKEKTLRDLDIIKKRKKEAIGVGNENVIKIEIANQKVLETKLKSLAAKKRAVTRTANIDLKVNTETLKKDLAKASSAVKSFEKTGKESTKSIGKSFRDMGKSIKTGIATMVSGFLVFQGIRSIITGLNDAKNVALERETAFTGVKKTTEGTAAEFKILNQELVDLTKIIPLTFSEIAKIAELGGQMGVPIDQIKEFTKAVANIAVTTNLSIEQAATQFARLHNILQLPLDAIEATASAVVDLGNNFAAQEDEILNFTTRIAGSGKIVGMTVGDLTGLSTALVSVGIKAEMGGTAMTKAMLTINDAVVGGGAEMEKFAKVSGMSAKEFSETWKKDASKAFVSFVDGIGKSGDSANKVISDLLGNNVRTKIAFLNLAGAGDLLAEAIDRGNFAMRLNVALSEEAALRYGTEESKLKILTNAYQEQQKIMGEQLLPGYVSLAKVKLQLLTGVIKLSDALGGMHVVILGLVTVLAGLALSIGLLTLPIIIALGAIVAIGAAIAEFGKDTIKTASYLDILSSSLQETTEALKDNKSAQDDLQRSYLDGKITLEEYRKETDKLLSAEIELEKEQQKRLNAIEKEIVIENAMKQGRKEKGELLLKEKEAKEKLTKAIEAGNIKEKALNEELERNKKLMSDEVATAIYKKGIDEVTAATKEHEKAVKKAGEAMTDSEEQTKSKTGLLRILKVVTEDAGEQQEMFDSLALDKTATKGELDAVMEKYNGVAAAARNATIEEIANAKSELVGLEAKRDKLAKADAFISSSIFNASLGKRTNDALEEQIRLVSDKTTALEEQEGLLNLINEYEFKPLTLLPTGGGSATKDLNAMDKILVSMGDDAETIEENLTAINSLLESGNLSEESKLKLLEKQGQLEMDLIALKEQDLEGIGEGVAAAATKNKIIEAEIELEKTKYLQRIANISSMYDDELLKARKLMQAKEEYELRVKELQDKGHENLLAQAEETIKMYEDLKKSGQKSFDDIGDSIEGVSKELGDFAEKMSEIRSDIEEINTDAIDELKKRYSEIVSELVDINQKITEQELSIAAAGDGTKSLSDEWKEVYDVMKESQKTVDDYKKSIDKINDSVTELGESSAESLAERYVELGDEIKTDQEELAKLNALASLSTEEAEKKLELDENITKALSEQQLAASEITQADIDSAELKATETTTEKIIRERDEKINAYNQELVDLEDKLNAEQQILTDAVVSEARLKAELNAIEISENQAKLDKLQLQLVKYYEEREALISEKAQAESELTAEEEQSALDKSLNTKTNDILKNRDLDLAAKQIELNDLKKQNQLKLDEMKSYYIEILKLQSMGIGQFGEGFSMDSFASDDVKSNLGGVDMTGVNDAVSTEYKQALLEQGQAVDKLAFVGNLIGDFLEKDKLSGDQMLLFLKKVVGLRADANVGQVFDSQTLNTVNQANTINVRNGLDLESIERMLRRSIQI